MAGRPERGVKMTKEEAIALFESGFWEHLTSEERAKFQMQEDLLCMPFGVFHKAVEETLGRPVYTHEFGLNRDGMLKELLENGPAPTLQEIIEMVPEEKRVIININPTDCPD